MHIVSWQEDEATKEQPPTKRVGSASNASIEHVILSGGIAADTRVSSLFLMALRVWGYRHLLCPRLKQRCFQGKGNATERAGSHPYIW